MAELKVRRVSPLETYSNAELSEYVQELSTKHAAECVAKAGISGESFVAAVPDTFSDWGIDRAEAARMLGTLGLLEISTKLEDRLVRFGQEHCLRWLKLGALSVSQARSLMRTLESLDLQRVSDVFASTKTGNSASTAAASESEAAAAESCSIEPPEESSCESLKSLTAEERREYERIGRQEIAENRAAVIILGGGQGTRLGFEGPKGMYNIGLPSGKSLFQLYAERVVTLTRLVEQEKALSLNGDRNGSQKPVVVPVFIMTSPLNHATTVGYFEANSFFGLPPEHVHFFPQGTLPALTEQEGKIIMKSGFELAESPDGNGGIYNALEVSGALAKLEGSPYLGCRSVHVFSVDNAISKVADPVFLGFCISRGAEVGNKVVWKRSAEERVGVVARKGGKPAIVEYTELSAEHASATDANGKLLFGAGNICNHYFTVEFLRKVSTAYKEEPSVMPLHVAVKKIPCAHPDTGATTAPLQPNGAKLEAFIFDSFPLAKSSAILEVPRDDEFTPVKNEPGAPSDSPDTALQMIMDVHRSWVEAAGGSFSSGASNTPFEVSPLLSYSGEALEEQCAGKEFQVGEELLSP